MKFGNPFTKVFACTQAARRGTGQGGISLAVINDEMARSSLLIISRTTPAKSMMPAIQKNPTCANLRTAK
jgi:hypothetical protein